MNSVRIQLHYWNRVAVDYKDSFEVVTPALFRPTRFTSELLFRIVGRLP